MSKEAKYRLTRRELLKAMGLATGAVALAGCGSPVAPGASPAEADTAPAANLPADAPAGQGDVYPRGDPRNWVVAHPVETPKKYDNLEISVNHVNWGSSYQEGETPEDNVTTRFLQEQTGVTFAFTWVAADNQAQWATALASGELPELMTEIPGDAYAQLLEADMLEDITEVWESTASPRLKELKGYPDSHWWDYCRYQGKLVAIPGFWGPLVSGSDLLWVRKDWLDQVGMEFPQTLDETAAVAKAFLGAGLAKIGIGASAGNWGWGTLGWVFGAFGYIPSMWRKGADGQFFYTSTDPAQKDALALLQQWYKDGILQQDFVKYTGDSWTAFTELAVGGQTGVNSCAYWAGSYLQEMKSAQPEVEWAFGNVPAGPTGQRGFWLDSGAGLISGFLAGADREKIEAIINQINFYIDIQDASRVGNGPSWEGYDYTIDKQGEHQTGDFPTDYLRPGGWEFTLTNSPFWNEETYKRREQLMTEDPEGKTWNPLEKKALADPTGGQQLQREAFFRINESVAEVGQSSDYVYIQPTIIGELQATLGPKEQEAYFRIIAGEDLVDAWDAWVESWRSEGGDQMTAAINEAYQKYAG
jgi:putative aldouronate transport system substrate-binding protein